MEELMSEVDISRWSFHLFQRVVGFRPQDTKNFKNPFVREFPSLSESSGFPTTGRR